jgi:cell division control protein 7
MATIRPRAKEPFEIHHDAMEGSELEEALETIEESRQEGDEHDQEDEYSEESDDSDDVVDEAVQEDMLRFQETFKGIKERFRLINRIGEGKSIYLFDWNTLIDAT